MQPALHDQLMERILAPENLRRAWRRVKANRCVFHAIADGYFSGSRTAFQTDRGRRFKLIVDAVSA
jgi:hypothetical protein